MGEECRLCADVFMGTHRSSELMGEPLPLGITHSRRPFKALLGLVAKGCDRFPQIQEPLFGLANSRDEDVTLAATAAAKAPHHFFAFLPQDVDLAVEFGGPATALLSDMLDEIEGFFCALYSVVASVTR